MRKTGRLFDEWPEAYDRWFTTPIGALVKRFEVELVLDLLQPGRGEMILDAGCGTGVFTDSILAHGARVFGLDISLPMLRRACAKGRGHAFRPVVGDLLALPFEAGRFDCALSITALEFIAAGEEAVEELFRVTRRGGRVLVATLNSLSPWAARRSAEARERSSIFSRAIFRSPQELLALAPVKGKARTAVHFQKEAAPEKAVEIEKDGRDRGLLTGAFVAALWKKP